MSIDSTVRAILKHGKILKVKDEFVFYPDQKYYRKFGFKSHQQGFKAETIPGLLSQIATRLQK